MDFLRLWEKELLRTGKSINTINSYINDIKKYFNWFEVTYDDKFNGQIIDIDVKLFESYLMNVKKHSIRTIERSMVSIRQFNDFLVQKGTSHPLNVEDLKLIKRYETSVSNVVILTNKEFNKLRRAVYIHKNIRDIAIFELLSNTGIRVSELVNLEMEDVKLTVRNGEQNFSLIKVREGKGSVYREVPLNRICKKALEDYLAVRPINDSNKIFIGERGPVGRFAINKLLKKYCQKSGIESIGPHVLRHTFATKLVKDASVDLVTVSKILGHSSTRVTENYYINTTNMDKLKAIENLEKIINEQ